MCAQTAFNVTEAQFVSIYRDNYKSFCVFANRYVNDPNAAEDIVGDTALKVWRKKDNVKNISALKAYFYTAIRNACVRHLENKKRRPLAAPLPTLLPNDDPDLLEHVIHTEMLQLLETEIYALPRQCRTVFIKLFLEGKSLSEAAQEMNLAIETVKCHRKQGIKLLRKRLPPAIFLVLLLHMHELPGGFISKLCLHKVATNVKTISKEHNVL
jgi:RNA polymerase sigma-70 factor (ECF subfamily)